MTTPTSSDTRSGELATSEAPSGGTPASPTAPRRPVTEIDRQLLDAAWANDIQAAVRSLDAGASVNAVDSTTQSAFLIATSEGYLDLLELCLSRGADPQAKDSFNGTGLIRAGERGHAAVVGRLMRAGTARDHVNRLGWTALHEALILGNGSERYADTVRVLVAGRVDVRLQSRRDGVAPLDHARRRGYAALAATLERAVAQDGQPAPSPAEAGRRLLAAAESGDADAAALALRAGADIEVRDSSGRTPLLLAATGDRLAVARVLVPFGADPDALDGRHDTAWLVTGVTGSVAMADVLLTVHPNLSIRNRFGGLSLIPASERGHVSYVRRVVATGIDVNHVNDLGWTALLEAAALGDGSARYQEIARILLEAGANGEIRDHDGRTALDHAMRKGHDEMAAALRRT